MKLSTYLLTACCLFPALNAIAAPPKPAPKRASLPPSKAKIAASRAAQAKEINASLRKIEAALSSDAARGRGSASDDELRAARFIAAELKRFGVAPAGQNGGFLQRVPLASVAQPGQLNDADAKKTTTNVVGILRGSDKNANREAILLTAHLDHLGVGRAVDGDSIYNGADDDASGVAAVLELARLISRGPRPRRTIVFALFGSEEIGGFGATYFHSHTPIPLPNYVANLEFEMIGRPDSAVAPRTLWLTGYERSDLGAALASHGARLVADPHPQQNFFARSDNYGLAKQGVIAHTVSSFNLHRDYHQPSDDIAHLDFAHMTDAIQSFLAPVLWLSNSKFVPKWKAGQRP